MPGSKRAEPAVASRSFLGPLGVSPGAEAVYAEVLAAEGVELAELDGRAAELAELIEAGLVHRRQATLVAVPVRLAVERWVSEQEARITRARLAASHFAATQRMTSGSFVELVRGLEDARDAARSVQTMARDQVRAFDREPYFRQGALSEVQEPVSARGVRYRVLYHNQALEDPATMATVRLAIGLGEDARSFHDVPMRMMIADEARALLILPYGRDPETGDPTDIDALVIHPSALLDALIRTFEAFWAFGVPIGTTDQAPTDRNRELLSLLVTGVTDASIARELGVSERTVHRRIRRLQGLLGVNSRFLLGVQAVKRGWI